MNGIQQQTILYIEDNEANRQLVEMILSRRPQLKLITAEDGTTGLAVADEHQPGMILLDISLPDMDGHEVLTRLKENARTKTIPVFALSGNATEDTRLATPAFDGYLSKPINIHTFYAAIDQVMGS
jgi:CheY-like chemotaxis protein